MSEMAEIFAGLAQSSRTKRANNRVSSAEVLKSNGVSFESNNHGVHLIVTHNDRVADFWPGTGKWKLRDSKDYHCGVFNLLKALK